MNKMEYMPVDCLQVPKVLFRLSCGSVFGRGERAAGSGRLSDL